MLGKSCIIKAEEYRSRWGARASNWLESRFFQSLNTRRDGKSCHEEPIAYRLFGKENPPDNAAGFPTPRRNLASPDSGGANLFDIGQTTCDDPPHKHIWGTEMLFRKTRMALRHLDIADMVLIVAMMLAVGMGFYLSSDEPPACWTSPQALPWLMMQVPACQEHLP